MKKKLSKDSLYAYQHTYLQYRRDPAKATFWLSVQPSMLTLAGTWERLMHPPPLGFSENNSRTDRPIVAKLGIGTYPLNYFTSFLKMSRPYLPWLLTCDLISKVMSSEIYVPYRFNVSTPSAFQRLKLANFGIFAGDMDMDRCCEVTPMVYTDIVTIPRSTEVIRGRWPLMTS